MTVFENVFAAAAHGGGLKRDRAYEAAIESLALTGMTSVANRRAETLGLDSIESGWNSPARSPPAPLSCCWTKSAAD